MLETFHGVLVGNCEGWKMLNLTTKEEHGLDIPPEERIHLAPIESRYALLPAHEAPIDARFVTQSQFANQSQLAFLSAHTLQIVSRMDIGAPFPFSPGFEQDTVLNDANSARFPFIASLIHNASLVEKLYFAANAFLLGAGPAFFESLHHLMRSRLTDLPPVSDYCRLVEATIQPLFDLDRLRSSLHVLKGSQEDYDLQLALDCALQWCRDLCNFHLDWYPQYSLLLRSGMLKWKANTGEMKIFS
jgi:hypothetical protein